MKNINEKAVRLVEGSVWQNKHGKTYTVLFVSNVTVNRKLADRFIPSVTFINAEGSVFTLDCDSFLRAYQWVENNDIMMTCIEQVYKCNAGEIDNDVNATDSFIDELEQEVGTDEQEPQEAVQEPVQQPVQEHQGPTLAEQLVKPFIVDFVTEGTPVLSKQELSRAFEGYSFYMDSRGVLFHKLMFSIRDNVIAYTLHQTFNPSVYKDEQNGYDLIHLNTGHVDFDIKWNAFGYIGAEVVNGCEYLVVVLADEPQEMFEQEVLAQETSEVVEEPTEQQETIEESEEQDDGSSIELANVETVESEEQDDGSSIELVNVETVEPEEQESQAEQPAEEPKIIAHLASPLDGIQVIHIKQLQGEQPQVEQPTEEPVEINVDDVKVERLKSEEEKAMDDYFDVVDITDAEAQKVADEVTKA